MKKQAVKRLMRARRWAEALPGARSAINAIPNDPELYGLAGLCLFRMNNWQEGSEYFRKAVALDPSYWEAGAKLAQCLERMDQNEEALEVAKRFSHVQPNDPTIQGLIDYLSPMVQGRKEGWERTTYLEYQIEWAGGDARED